MPVNPSHELARATRISVLKMVSKAKAAHVGSSLSMVDILAVLYADILKHNPQQPDWAERDRLIISKGHAAAAVYAVLAQRGYFSLSTLDTYCQNGAALAGHVTHHGVPGVEASTGSLGHGLPIGCGLALGLRADKNPGRVFVLLSDGECDEGSNWEAALFAPHHKLDNLTVIIDYNKIQSFGRVADVLALEPFADKWRAFNWQVETVDGHDHAALHAAFMRPTSGKPKAIIANTIKGKGVSFMEDQLLWHYRSPSPEQVAQALKELGE